MADARLSALSGEATSDGAPDRRLSAVAAEVLTDSDNTPAKRLSAFSAESITDSAGPNYRRLSSFNIEVLAPANYVFVGWGMPV